MIAVRRLASVLCVLLLITLLSSLAAAQQFNPDLYQKMRWRMIGPHRGGRTVGATGVPGQPNVFYIGVNNGGVWKTNDYGHTWTPIFDDQPTGSIGALAVAPSNPDIVYVGSGEGLQRPDLSTGDGMYKSTDAGKTWKHLGLGDGQQIGAIIVDPKDAEPVIRRRARTPLWRERRARRVSLDRRRRDFSEGALQRRKHRRDRAGLRSCKPANHLCRSVGGATGAVGKRRVAGAGKRALQINRRRRRRGGNSQKGFRLSSKGWGASALRLRRATRADCMRPLMLRRNSAASIASTTRAKAGSDVNGDTRLWGRGSDFAELKVDPKNPDIVYVANIASWRSTDAGRSFTGFRGAPGGDDYHTIWINPDNPQIILLATDQGAVITVNGGQTWSSWYNQPTAQFYHVITDNQFPYWVYGGQQESGSVGIASRGDDGQITFREWHPVGVEEYGYVAPDPLNPDIIYGGKITRYDRSDGSDAEHRARSRAQRQIPIPSHSARHLLAGRPARSLLRGQCAFQDYERRAQLGDHQRRPLARSAGSARQHRHISHG